MAACEVEEVEKLKRLIAIEREKKKTYFTYWSSHELENWVLQAQPTITSDELEEVEELERLIAMEKELERKEKEIEKKKLEEIAFYENRKKVRDGQLSWRKNIIIKYNNSKKCNINLKIICERRKNFFYFFYYKNNQ